MACFNTWDIGGCGCGTSACTLAAGFPVGGGNWCCICGIGANLTFTLNSAFCGQTSFTLYWIDSAFWPGFYTSTYDYGPTASDGSVGTFFSNCFTDGTNSYIFVYDGQPLLFKFLGTACAPAYFSGSEAVPQTGLSGYQCAPSFTATYAVTSGQTTLYGAGVRTVAVTGKNAEPMCTAVVTCKGCRANFPAGQNIQVWDHSGGTLLNTYATDVSGNITVPFGSYWVIPTGGRFAGQTSAVYGAVTDTFTAASGYYCPTAGVCVYPLPGTLHCTFVNAGAQTFTYSSGHWTASFTYLSIAYVLNLATNLTMTATSGGTGFTATFSMVHCPVVGPFSGTITVPGSGLGHPLGNGTITE